MHNGCHRRILVVDRIVSQVDTVEREINDIIYIQAREIIKVEGTKKLSTRRMSPAFEVRHGAHEMIVIIRNFGGYCLLLKKSVTVVGLKRLRCCNKCVKADVICQKTRSTYVRMRAL